MYIQINIYYIKLIYTYKLYIILFSLIIFILFCMFECFAYMYVSVTYKCLVSAQAQARRWPGIPWN